MGHAFYNIGHGRRPIGEFVDLLREVEVTLLADLRTMPRSRAKYSGTPSRGARLAAYPWRASSRLLLRARSTSTFLILSSTDAGLAVLVDTALGF